MRLYRIVLPYAVFGVITDVRGTIIEAAPIAKWSIGKKISWLAAYCANKCRSSVQQIGGS
jgi:hypothetical protein